MFVCTRYVMLRLELGACRVFFRDMNTHGSTRRSVMTKKKKKKK